MSVAVLEYVVRDQLVAALAGLRARLAKGGRLLLFITRNNWITKPLIGMWWKANLYKRGDLEDVLSSAGFQNVVFKRFPCSYFWQNRWAYIVECS